MESEKNRKGILEWTQGILIFLFFALSTVFLMNVRGQYAYLYVAALIAVVAVVYAIVRRKAVILPSVLIPLVFLSLFSGWATSHFYPMPEAYTYAARIVPVLKLPYIFIIAYVYVRMKEDRSVLDAVVLGIKATVAVQLIWIPLQYAAYHKLGLDISDLVFNQWLHRDVVTLFVREGVYHPSGLAWHSGLIAPMFVIGFLMFKNPLIRIVLIMEAMIIGSSTAVAGVVAAAGLMILVAATHPKDTREEWSESLKNTPKAVMVLFGALLIGAVAYVILSGMYQTAVDSVVRLVNRVIHSKSDGSARAHFGYFKQYFEIIKQAPLLNVLFGYGADCSGYPFQEYYSYYMSLSAYTIECDYVNIALNHGIIGFVLYYSMLGYIAVKGAKTDPRYLVFILCILLQGIGYNVQWDYVFVFELVLFASLKANVNFFDFRWRKKYETTLAKNGFLRFLVRL